MNVSAKSNVDGDQLISYVRNELRKINDVEVISDARLQLDVVILRVGSSGIYAASALVRIRNAKDDLDSYISSWLFTDDTLESLAKQIATSCDTGVFETFRQFDSKSKSSTAAKPNPTAVRGDHL